MQKSGKRGKCSVIEAKAQGPPWNVSECRSKNKQKSKSKDSMPIWRPSSHLRPRNCVPSKRKRGHIRGRDPSPFTISSPRLFSHPRSPLDVRPLHADHLHPLGPRPPANSPSAQRGIAWARRPGHEAWACCVGGGVERRMEGGEGSHGRTAADSPLSSEAFSPEIAARSLEWRKLSKASTPVRVVVNERCV